MAKSTSNSIASAELARSESGRDQIRFRNQFFELKVDIDLFINPSSLVHLKSGHVLADEDYCYQVDLASAESCTDGYSGGPQQARRARLLEWELEDEVGDATTLKVSGRLDFGETGPTDIIIEHRFSLFRDADRFDEQITLVHRYGHDKHEVADYRFGFRKRLFDATTSRWVGHVDEFRLGAVPFRRRRGHGQDWLKEDYSTADLVPDNWAGNDLPNRQSEAWSWQDGETGFVFSKYAQHLIEFALVDGEFYTRPNAEQMDSLTELASVGDICLRFLGAGRTNGAPGRPVVINAAQREFRFGTSTILPFVGAWQAGHRAYGAHLRQRGHVVPKGFSPPVHWNELYNLGWRGTNSPLQELPELWEEARRAQLMGVEAFYFDPVWDIFEGSSIWDTNRLGELTDFVGTLKDEYDLSLSLHLMMHAKSDQEDPRIYRRAQDGTMLYYKGAYTGGYACCASHAWQDVKTERLLTLARSGVSYFMFDFCEYALPGTTGDKWRHGWCDPCFAPDHGHSVPATLEEHAEGLGNVMKRVKAEFPGLLIEAHDAVTAGWQDFLPLYYGHGVEEMTFDEHWGFEFMWNSFLDLLSGKALSLYEYNLAYDIPLYLHINLRFDNDNALAFWWYASTCRHLGIGGLKPGDAIWDSHVAAMKTYMRLKPHFSRGRFSGLDLDTHGHVLDDEKSAVIVLFNRTSSDRKIARTYSALDLGLPDGLTYEGRGVTVSSGELRLTADMPALSAHVFELEWT